MAQDDFCKSCSEKSRCREAFTKLGGVQGKSVVKGVFLAFVLPLFVFITVLAASLEILKKYVESDGLRTAFSLLPAFFASAAFVALVKIAAKRFGKR